jgi:hypothetical protein
VPGLVPVVPAPFPSAHDVRKTDPEAMDQRRAHVLAWSLLGIALFVAAVGLALFVLARGAPQPVGGFGVRGVALVPGVIGAVAGFLVARKEPSNPIGWLLLTGAPGFFVYELPTLYAQIALYTHPGSLPGGEIAAWLTSWDWGPSLVLLALVLLLFPNGRLLSP